MQPRPSINRITESALVDTERARNARYALARCVTTASLSDDVVRHDGPLLLGTARRSALRGLVEMVVGIGTEEQMAPAREQSAGYFVRPLLVISEASRGIAYVQDIESVGNRGAAGLFPCSLMRRDDAAARSVTDLAVAGSILGALPQPARLGLEDASPQAFGTWFRAGSIALAGTGSTTETCAVANRRREGPEGCSTDRTVKFDFPASAARPFGSIRLHHGYLRGVAPRDVSSIAGAFARPNYTWSGHWVHP